MKTKKPHAHKKIHHSSEDLLFAVGASVASTGLVLMILFAMILCSFRYTFKKYYTHSLLQVEAAYTAQFNSLRDELSSLRERLDTATPAALKTPSEDLGDPELVP